MANLSEEEIKIAVPVITFILGFFSSRFTMSKKEKKDYEINLLAAANKLLEEQNKAFQEFAECLFLYANKKENPDLNDFFSISTKGELYFNRINISCDAIIANKVDRDSVINSFVPKVKECVERSLPDFYKTLKEISSNSNISYSGDLRRENYESLFTVYEKYC